MNMPSSWSAVSRGEPDSEQLMRDAYATTINIANAGDEPVHFTKRLALTLPLGRQESGRTAQIGNDALDPEQALKTDCPDIIERVFDGRSPGVVLEGLVIIRAPRPLEVRAVYSASAPERRGRRIGGDVDVETMSPSTVLAAPLPQLQRHGLPNGGSLASNGNHRTPSRYPVPLMPGRA